MVQAKHVTNLMSSDREEIGPTWNTVCECLVVIKMDDTAPGKEGVSKYSTLLIKIVAARRMGTFGKPAEGRLTSRLFNTEQVVALINQNNLT